MFSLLPLVGFFPAVVAFVWGLVEWGMASWDLTRMRWGEMDPNGRALTRKGRAMAGWAMVLALGMAYVWVIGYANSFLP
jgi:hypothetical protein